MIQTSGEICAKVFAKYIGQNVVIPENFQFQGCRTSARKGELTGIKNDFIRIDDYSGFYPCDQFKLILKPLSAITEEDADFIHSHFKFANYDDFLDKKKIALKYFKYMEVDYTYEYGIHPRDMSIFGIPPFKHVNIFQFLQSKGYDIPQNILEGRTLKEAGLAIYETEL